MDRTAELTIIIATGFGQALALFILADLRSRVARIEALLMRHILLECGGSTPLSISAQTKRTP